MPVTGDPEELQLQGRPARPPLAGLSHGARAGMTDTGFKQEARAGACSANLQTVPADHFSPDHVLKIFFSEFHYLVKFDC